MLAIWKFSSVTLESLDGYALSFSDRSFFTRILYLVLYSIIYQQLIYQN